MISNHYAMTFGARYNWLVLIAISAAGLLIRAYFVSRHKRHERGGKTSPWAAVVGLLIIAATAAALAPKPTSLGAALDTPQSQFAAVQHIIATRCAPCHAANPSQPGFSTAPNGVLLDTSASLLSNAAVIAPQVETAPCPSATLPA